MDFLIGILGSIIGNFLTDLTKSVMHWDRLFGTEKLQPSRVVPPTQPGEPAPDKQARRRRNRARAESVKWTSNMVIWTVIMLFSSAMLPILLSSRLNINVNLMYTRLSWIPIENVSAIKIALTLSAIAFIPVFIVGQIATQYFERFYDREWGDVTPQKYFIFYMRAMLPLIIVYAGFVVFSFYPQMDMLESFRYPVYVVGGMFVAAAMGYRS